MPTIDHANMLSLHDLAELARECGSVIEAYEDEYSDEVTIEELEEAKDTLKALAKLVDDLNRPVNEDDADDVASELEFIGNSVDDTLIHEDHFPEYVKELVELPDNLPDYITSNIDWDGVASDLQHDYTNIKLDGEDYLIR